MVSLTVEKARRLTEPGRYGDGGGLYLNIAKGGSKSWVQRLYVEGKRLDKGLGGFPKVSLTDARKMATSNRAAVAEGRNPWADGQPRRRRVSSKSRRSGQPPSRRMRERRIYGGTPNIPPVGFKPLNVTLSP